MASDAIDTNAGDDIVLGDNGLLDYVSVNGNPADLDIVTTLDPRIGGNDTIFTRAGDDIVIGEAADDFIDAGSDDDLVLGDNGTLDYASADGDGSDIDVVTSLDPAIGGADTIFAGTGDDIVIAGTDRDSVDAGEGNDVVIGDSGRITAATVDAPQTALPITIGVVETIASGVGDADSILAGSGDDVVLGGDWPDDSIDSGAGDDLVLGDNGLLDYVSADGDPADIDLVTSLDPAIGGTDAIRLRATATTSSSPAPRRDEHRRGRRRQRRDR